MHRPFESGGRADGSCPSRSGERTLAQVTIRLRRHPSQRSTIGRVEEFVPLDFEVPRRLETPQFVLEPLDPEHNDEDYDAWTSSGEHIHATPGWEDSSWPREMTLDENRADLQRHADDFRSRTGFTYTVLDPASGDVIGASTSAAARQRRRCPCALLGTGEPRAARHAALARRE